MSLLIILCRIAEKYQLPYLCIKNIVEEIDIKNAIDYVMMGNEKDDKLLDKIKYPADLRKIKREIQYSAVFFRDTIGLIVAQKKVLLLQLILSLLIWSLFALKAVILAWNLNLEISFIAISVVTYLSYMIAVVPLLPGGVGTFEAGMVFLLIPASGQQSLPQLSQHGSPGESQRLLHQYRCMQ